MKIKIIPETEAEKSKYETKTYEGVADFFLCARRLDGDKTPVDVHEWRGQLSYLIGMLSYYREVINDERRIKQVQDLNRRAAGPTGPAEKMVRRSAPTQQEVEVLNSPQLQVVGGKRPTLQVVNNVTNDDDLQKILDNIGQDE